MKRVLKTAVPIDDQWHTIEVGPIGHVGQQYEEAVTVWWEERDVQPRTVRVFGTGHEIPDLTTWLGTVQSANGLVWHLFEVAIADETGSSEPCAAEIHSWERFTSEQVDSYWIRCTLTGPHREHEDSNTGLTWTDA
jgi:hypothetical protein